MIAGALAGKVEGLLKEAAEGFSDDPVLWIIRILRKIGAILIVVGISLGIAGFYLKASAISAVYALQGVYKQLASIWGNIQPLTFTPAATGTAPIFGPNPMQDLTNFGQDALTDLGALGSDIGQIGGALGTLGEDIAIGVVDLAKSLYSIGQNFPGILWNGLVAVIGGGIADVLNWAFPYLILFGIFALGVSIGLSVVRSAVVGVWSSSIKPSFDQARARWAARQRKTVWTPIFDRIFGNRPDPEISSSSAVPSSPPLTTRGTARGAAAGGAGAAAPAAAPVTPAPELPGPGPKPPAAPPAAPADLPAPPAAPELPAAPEGPTREDLEQLLGEALQQQRDLFKAEQRTGARIEREVRELEDEETEADARVYELLNGPLAA